MAQVLMLPKKNETEDEYLLRIYSYKVNGLTDISWTDIADIMEEYFEVTRSPEGWRKKCGRLRKNDEYYCDDFGSCNNSNTTKEPESYEINEGAIAEEEELPVELLNRIRIETIKLNDQRTAINRDLRNRARDEELKLIALDAAKIVASSGKFLSKPIIKTEKATKKDGTLLISDWHYGLEINNYWNKFNPEICRNRVEVLRDKALDIIKKEGLTHINVVNLGDMIAGLIHQSIKYNSRCDVVSQILDVSTIIAEFIDDLSEKVNIDYYWTLDNHSRLDPNKDETTKLCQLSRITTPYIKALLQNNKRIIFHEDNELSESIIRFEIFGHKVAGTHGDKDKQAKAIKNLKAYATEQLDLVVMAHMHHFSANEENFTRMICNGSLMGTDEFAENLRLTSTPSQTMIISTPESVVENLYIINLN